jgi:Cu(I)/Ag(I) efflux system membrane fusion protein
MHPEIIKDEPGQCDICGMDLVPAESLGYASAGKSHGGAPLVIPATAALLTGTRAVVYVEQPEADRPTYVGREVVLGPRAGDSYVVESGLSEGDLVVVSGNFKIDSALQIQAKPSMMNPEGGGSGGGHDHGSR